MREARRVKECGREKERERGREREREQTMDSAWRKLSQFLSALLEEAYSNLHRVTRRVFKEDGEELQSQQLMSHLLVDKVSYKLDR